MYSSKLKDLKIFYKTFTILYRCNASIRKQNDRGQTPYDIAVSAGSSSVLSLMAAHLGQGLLLRHTKARSPSGLDTFSWDNPHFILSASLCSILADFLSPAFKIYTLTKISQDTDLTSKPGIFKEMIADYSCCLSNV